MVVAIGIPLDENSSYLKGPAAAPARIREAYHSDSANYCAEDGTDLEQYKKWKDLGDLKLSPMPDAFVQIEQAVSDQLDQGNKVLSLGGDHSVTYPAVKAFSKKYSDLNILHIDAHSDLYDHFGNNKFSHACPFARIMEERLARRLVQVGIRTLNPLQRAQADKFGVEIIEMKNWQDTMRFDFGGPLYISLDLDAIDPAFVPGISHYEPGGFSVRQVLSIIQNLKANLVGADIVELNPARDIQNMTAMVAAKFYKELLIKLLH
ncbi:MAG: agmatinase [Bacteroidota bacterium]